MQEFLGHKNEMQVTNFLNTTNALCWSIIIPYNKINEGDAFVSTARVVEKKILFYNHSRLNFKLPRVHSATS
jgi:hypothetical protein